MDSETTALIGTISSEQTFSNRHHSRSYPAGTLVEVLNDARDGWMYCRVLGTKSIKGYVRADAVMPL